MLFLPLTFNIDSFYFLAFLETTTDTFVFVLHLFIFQRTTRGTINNKNYKTNNNKKATTTTKKKTIK